MKKINWKVIAVLTVLCILGGAYTLAFADTSVDQKTTLNGVVLADGLAAVGMQVSEGQVLVKPGDNISNGQTVVRIAAN